MFNFPLDTMRSRSPSFHHATIIAMASTMIAAVSFTAPPVNAATVFYDDQAEFLTATSGLRFTRDTFDTPIAGGTASITFDSGVVSQVTEAVGDLRQSANSVNDGSWFTFLGVFDGTVDQIVWTLPEAVTALSFDYLRAGNFGGGSRSGTYVVVNGDDRLVNPVEGSRGQSGFFGFTTDTPFTTVTIDARVGGDNFEIDNLAFGPTTVPLPFSAFFLLSAIGALVLVGRQKA